MERREDGVKTRKLEHSLLRVTSLPLMEEYLQFLSVCDFIRQTPDSIVPPINPQVRKLFQQSLVPTGVIPARQDSDITHIIVNVMLMCQTVLTSGGVL